MMGVQTGEPAQTWSSPITRIDAAWRWLSRGVIVCIFAGMLYWMGANPYPTGWDNAGYLNACTRDANAFKNAGISGLINSLLYNDRYRPPAYRLLVLPVTLIADVVTLTKLRLISLVAFGATLWLIYLAVKRVAGTQAGLLAAMILVAIPTCGSAIRAYGSESALYPSIAATLYFLVRWLNEERISHWTWIGLGISLAAGTLAKLSYPWIVGPMLAVCIVQAFRQRSRSKFVSLLKAGILAVVLALPWYCVNYTRAMSMAKASQGFDRTSMGPPSWKMLTTWFGALSDWGIGPPLMSLLAGLVALSFIVWVVSRVRRSGADGGNDARIAIWLCILGALPFPIAQLFFSSNQDIRVLSPVFLPVLAAVAITAGATNVLKHWPVFVAVSVVLLWQLSSVSVGRFHERLDAWDWETVYQMSVRNGQRSPTIAHLGCNAYFNVATIQVPWVQHNETPTLSWLWRQEQGPINWTSIDKTLRSIDLVLVTPEFKGEKAYRRDADNVNSAEFDRRMHANQEFMGPIVLMMGRSDPVKLHAYIRRKNHSTPSTRPRAATRAGLAK